MAEHFDVIIVGTGAGGGTLAHTLAPSGETDPAARAGRLPAARDGELGSGVGVHRRPLHLERYLVRRRRQAVPAAGALLRRRRDEALRRRAVPPAPAGLRGAEARRRRVARLAGLVRRLRALLHEGRVALSGARRARRRSHRRPVEQAVSRGRPCRTSRASSRSSTTCKPAGYHPFPAPCGILLDEADRARSTCIRCTWCDGYPCLVHAKSDAETIAVRPAARSPNVTLLVNAEVVAARNRRGRPHASPASSCRAQRQRGVLRPTSSWSGRGRREQRQAAARARPTTSTRTGSRTAPIRSAATTCSTTARRSSRWRRSATTRCSRRRSAINDFYFGADDYQWPIGNIQMVGKSNAEAMKGEEPMLTKLAPHWSLDEVAASCRRLLAHDRRPAAARQPRHARRRRQRASSRTSRRTTRKPTGSTTSSRRC